MLQIKGGCYNVHNCNCVTAVMKNDHAFKSAIMANIFCTYKPITRIGFGNFMKEWQNQDWHFMWNAADTPAIPNAICHVAMSMLWRAPHSSTEIITSNSIKSIQPCQIKHWFIKLSTSRLMIWNWEKVSYQHMHSLMLCNNECILAK